MSETASATYVTASMLYDIENCEHRPWMDLYADPNKRDAVSPFVDMLWRRGRVHEDEVVAASSGAIPIRQEQLR
jgi:hypothetical protein